MIKLKYFIYNKLNILTILYQINSIQRYIKIKIIYIILYNFIIQPNLKYIILKICYINLIKTSLFMLNYINKCSILILLFHKFFYLFY